MATSHVHPLARAGFDHAADLYDRARPGYADAALALIADELGIGPGAEVLDLAAGTGTLSRRLASTGAAVVAVEPLDGMRAKLRERLPDVRALAGTAESIPLPVVSVDAAVVGQAFHWFDGAAALRELHRVLRPSGGLAVLFNRWARDDGWVARLRELLDSVSGDAPRQGSGAWREPFRSTDLFDELRARSFDNPWQGDRDAIMARVASISFVSALPRARRDELLREVEKLLDSHPDTAGGAPVREPYVTQVSWCFRRDAPLSA